MSGRAGDCGAISPARFTGSSSSGSRGMRAGAAFSSSLSDPGSAAGGGIAAGPAAPLQGGHAAPLQGRHACQAQAGSGAGPCPAAARPLEWPPGDSGRERLVSFRSGSAPATPTSPQPQALTMSSLHQQLQMTEGQPQIQPFSSEGVQVFS